MPFELNPVGVVIIVVFVIYLVVWELAKKVVYQRFERAFTAGDYDECLRLLDTRPMRVMYPAFNMLFMRMNVYMAQGDAKRAGAVVDRLLSMRANKAARTAVATRAQVFFERMGDNSRARQMHDLLT